MTTTPRRHSDRTSLGNCQNPTLTSTSVLFSGNGETSFTETGKASPLIRRISMPNPHRILLVRHGETEFNLIGLFQGQKKDSPLTQRGIAQARRNGQVIARLIDDPTAWRIVSSPLGRTLETARLICRELGVENCKVETDERIQEVGFGIWEGLDREQIEAMAPEVWRRRQANRWNHVVQGGESLTMVAERVATWMAEMVGNMIVVSHGTTGRVLRGLYLDLTPEKTIAQDQPQDIVFELRGGQIFRH